MNLQEIIDHGLTYDVIPLPLGEYEGPFYVRKPCTLVGNVTTLWSKEGPALVVESTGVTLANLRVENIGKQEGEDLALLCKVRDTACQNIEIIGRAQGMNGEEGQWLYPRVLSLGHFPANQSVAFKLEIVVPVAVEVTTNITGLSIEPTHLEPGRRQLTLQFKPARQGTFFYGEILLHSQLVHTMYVSALANEAVTELPQDLVYTPEAGVTLGSALEQSLVLESALAYPASGHLTPSHPELDSVKPPQPPLRRAEPPGENVLILQRGERRALPAEMNHALQLTLTYTERQEVIDIDPYVVLLDKQGKAQRDEDLIFFGNVRSQCGSVLYQENDKQMSLCLEKVPASVERLAIIFSIYGEQTAATFARLADVALQVKSGGQELWRFPIIDLTVERTIVAAEIYRYHDQWKLNAVGAGYREGLARLLKDYGLDVIE